VNKLGVIVYLIPHFLPFFAQSQEIDSLRLNFAEVKKVLYSGEEDLIPPTLPDDPSCLSAGCCLIPLTGSILGGQRILGKVDTVPSDTTKERIKRWGFGIGYSGGIYYTGKDLRKSYGSESIKPPWELIAEQLYWLNSLEGSVSYTLTKLYALEIGFGYAWTNIPISDEKNWDFELFPLYIGGLVSKSFEIKAGYIYSRAQNTQGLYTGEGKGNGFIGSIGYRFNNILGINCTFGRVVYEGEEEILFPLNLYLSGMNIFVGYRF
jgi:hypothetical protein